MFLGYLSTELGCMTYLLTRIHWLLGCVIITIMNDYCSILVYCNTGGKVIRQLRAILKYFYTQNFAKLACKN